MRIASIGPITSKTVRDQGRKVDVEARRHDIDGLVQAISEFFKKT
jgi:uroporphyrinogen III methyltransferase/synthase